MGGRARIREPCRFFMRGQVVGAEKKDRNVERRGGEPHGRGRKPGTEGNVAGAAEEDGLSRTLHRRRKGETNGEVTRGRGNQNGRPRGMVGDRKSVGEFREDPEAGDAWAAGEVNNPQVAARGDANMDVLAFGKDSGVLTEGVDDFMIRTGGRDGETALRGTDV